MKKRYEDWWKLTGGKQAPIEQPVGPPIRVLDLNGFQEVEDKLLIYRPRKGELPLGLDAMIDGVSQQTFGIIEDDTLFDLPDGYERMPDWAEERWAIEERWDAHERQYETATATDDEAVAILLRLGLDFRDARNQPMLSVLLFARQAEAAAKGYMGKMPDRGTVGLESWAKALERDARNHMTKKRTG